ncbi:flavodoxin family protein [Candidatus Poribacteria bacterium]|nr:flavodoxin family protein [Candidatus Poribacteria bacterium]
MQKVLIIYYSRSGNTEAMAEFVAEGVRNEGLNVECKRVQDTKPEDLLEVDGIILGSPTYYGTMAAELKKLIDESVKYHGKLESKVGAAFSSSGGVGGGNETTVMEMLKALMIHGMIIQGDSKSDHYGPIAVGKPDDRSRNECIRRGARVAKLVKRLAL